MATDETIARKLHALLPTSVDAELRFSSIVVRGSVAFTVTVLSDGIGIISNHGAGFELLPAGLTYAQIAAHLSAVALGHKSGALQDSKVMVATGDTWAQVA